MATGGDLTEALLADLDDSDASGAPAEGPDMVEVPGEEPSGSGAAPGAAGVLRPPSLEDASPLLTSGRLRDELDRVRSFEQRVPPSATGAKEREEGYALAVETNALANAAVNEATQVSRWVRQRYADRFPELDEVLALPRDHANAVLLVGSAEDLTRVDYASVFSPHTAMLVSLAASTSKGRRADDLSECLRGSRMVIELLDARDTLVAFVQSRMAAIAPNLTAVVGSAAAAELLSAAGGISQLSNLPAGTIALLGKRRATSAFVARGVATYAGGAGGRGPDLGAAADAAVVARSEPVMQAAREHAVKAARVVCNKVALAARLDASGSDPSGGAGRRMRDDIDGKVAKWLEPPPQRQRKPLPAPGAEKKRKRGGRRARAMRERHAVTEYERRAARVTFNGTVADDADDSDEENLVSARSKRAALGSMQGAAARAAGAGSSGTKTQGRLAKKYKDILTQQGGDARGGTLTSLAFGATDDSAAGAITLDDPAQRARAAAQAQQKFFGAATPFTHQ